jgi:hypothetical protein
MNHKKILPIMCKNLKIDLDVNIVNHAHPRRPYPELTLTAPDDKIFSGGESQIVFADAPLEKLYKQAYEFLLEEIMEDVP